MDKEPLGSSDEIQRSDMKSNPSAFESTDLRDFIYLELLLQH
jgi:hypothetical protein